MRKRLISVLFVMVLFSLAVCVFASCNKKHTHEFGEWTVEKQATCEENGAKVRKCNGCDETERETINALGHTYGEFVEGTPPTCTVCGHVRCDHKTLHTKTLDLHEQGLCASVFTYRVCDCGTVLETDDDFLDSLNCSIDSDVWNAAFPESEAEKGEVHGEVTCEKCGLNIGITMQFTEEECLFRAHYIITLKKDDKVLLDHAVADYESHDHFEVREEIKLDSADGFCGGTLAVLKCKYCGEITKKLALKPTCDFDFVHGLTETEETDANGVKHAITRGVCPDCGLTKEFDTWTEKNGCDEVLYRAERIYRGDNVLLSMTDEKWQKSHNFSLTCVALGEGGCEEDGVKLTYRCTVCNLSTYSYQYSHTTMYDTIKIKELGGCDTQIAVLRCVTCGEIFHFNPEYNVEENNCQMEKTVQTYTKDGVEHTVTTNTCSECGLQIIVDGWEVLHGKNGGCGYTGYEFYRVIYGGEDLISYLNVAHSGVNHDWDDKNATYECDTPNMACEDGYYTAITTCKRCDEKQALTKYGHDKEDVGIELDDYGCGGYVGGWRCMRCGDFYSDTWNFDCEKNGTLVWSTSPTETTDKNGLVHKTWTGTCSACGLTFIREEWAEQEDAFGCRVKYYVTYQIINGDEVILAFHSDEVVDKHNDNEHMKTVYDREGDCEDGYYKTTYCPTCGLARADEENGHQRDYRSIDAASDFCEGIFSEEYCAVCDKILSQSAQLECNFVDDEGSDGQSGTCSVCGAKVLYFDKDEEIDPCHRITFRESHYINKNGEEVYTIISGRFSYTTHKEEYQFELKGTSCTEGYRVRKICSVCDEVLLDWEEKFDHGMYDLFVLDNVDGVCESHVGAVKVRGCACGYWCDLITGDFAPADGVEDGNTRTFRFECPDCELKLVETVTVTEDGCKKITARTVRITLGEKELYSGGGTAVSSKHSFDSFEMIESENGLTLRTTCKQCGEHADTEIALATHPEGRTDWSYVFTPAVSGTYTFRLLVNKKIEVFEKQGNHFVYKDYNPNGRIQISLKAGQTYQLSWAESETPEKWEAYIAILPDHTDCESSPNNNGYGALLPGSETCEDGMLYWNYCSYCGTIADYDSMKVYYEHKTWHWYYVNSAFCGFGQFPITECACGEQFEISSITTCKDAEPEIVDSEYFGGCKLEKFSCEKCGLNYEIYYKTDGNNKISEYLYVVIKVQDKVVYSWGTPPASTITDCI